MNREDRKDRNVLDWSLDEVADWTKPKWYEKLTVITILILTIGRLATMSPTPTVIAATIGTIIIWYIFLMFVIEDIKTKIVAWRIKRAAVRRYHRKYLLQNLFEKHPWLETYLREVKRAEELGFPYVPDIIIKDPATAKIEIRRPPQTRWWLPQTQTTAPTPQTPTQPAQTQQPAPPPEQQPQQPPGRRGESISLPQELKEVYKMIKKLVESLSIEETHTLFRIMAEMKGYGSLPKTYVANQFINLPHPTLIRYLDKGEMPTTPTRVANMQKRTILPTLRRDLATNPTLLIATLRKFADQHPQHQQEVTKIIEAIMRPPPEETEKETEEETPT